ncbi:MAG: hypothetical protein Q7J30_02745 [Candidatus Azambacteria bacterium]|nr:hypothetical protein [Candidatus Azambacteria bacterium]
MTEPIQKPEDIIVRTMKGDLAVPVPKLPSVETKGQQPIAPISQEAQIPALKTAPTPKAPAGADIFARSDRPPVLIVPPKTIPPKNIPDIPIKPLFKVTPIWIKLGMLGLAVILISLSGLYGYWKIFIQSKPPAVAVKPPTATTTAPTLPTAPTVTTTAPIKFFNKLPNKSVIIDLPSKTLAALTQALKSEAKVAETRASVKQLGITYQGKPLTAEEFFDLMLIFAPANFLSNYEDEFVLAFFNQKEGARPILIMKAKNKDLAKTQMADWEKTSLASDISPLFLDSSKLSQSLPSFKSYSFVNQPVRYLNVNKSFASLNYTVYNDFLIFATSSAGMFVILQDLTGQTVSFDYIKSLEASINKFVK